MTANKNTEADNNRDEAPIEGADLLDQELGEPDEPIVSATPPAAKSGAPEPWPLRRATLVALIVSAAFFMEMLDATIITPAIPGMAKDFGTSAVAVSSGISAYLITGAIFIPASVWMSDRFGARNVFCFAIIVFTFASVLCGLSQTLTQFTLARILQGMGGAMMSPVGRIEVFRRSERIHTLRLIAFITWPGLSAFIVGPSLGGLLTTYVSWHWIFFINVPIGLIGLILVWTFFDKGRGAARRPFDGLGFVLNGGALACFIFGIESVSRNEPLWFAIGFCLAGIAIGAAAVWHAFHTANPLLSLVPLRIQSFAAAIIHGGALFRITAAAIGFLIPLMLQVAFGMSAFDTGLMLAAFLTGDLAVKPLANRLLRLYGFRNVLIYQSLVFALGGASLLLLEPRTPMWLMAMMLFAVGSVRSVHYTALNSLIFADIPSHLVGAASTLNSMAQQTFTGIGIAFAALVLAVLSGRGQEAPSVTDFRIALLIMLGLVIVTLVTYIPLPKDVGESVSGRLKRKREREQS